MASTKDELMPIAIVGMSCRLPGNVSSPGEFWQLLSKARSGWSKIPKSRFNDEAYRHPDPEKKGTFNSTGGYFLNEDLEMFDPGFFDMTKKEAETMDPIQRLLLECSYEALENAGMPKEKISGQNMGVFIGGPDNEHRIGNLRDLDDVPAFDPTGAQGAFLAGRISYYFNLKGPAFTLDTACSSSMYALHMAVQSIRSGESDSAMVGASHLITQPDVWVSMAKLRLFSESGRCNAFDHRARSGYARGEGAGVIVLKPLHQAIADGDYVRAVIAHTGVSHNGRTVGIVAPSTDEQEILISRCLKEANVDPEDVGFFEAHGTGTRVGDPIEAEAIYRAVGSKHSSSPRPDEQPLFLGSVKSNIGHLENASGLISIIKAALILEKGFVVGNADFEKANPKIPLDKWNMKILTRQHPLSTAKKHVCVNNFGYSGSNAHAILRAAPPEPTDSFLEEMDIWTKSKDTRNREKRLFILSANDESAVRATMSRLGIFLEQHAELYQTTMPRNLAYTLSDRRSHLPWRVAIVSDMCSSLAIALNSPDAVAMRAPPKPPKLAFIFTGQGAQWYAMGRELLASHRVFAESIRRSTDHLLMLGAEFSLLKELQRSKEDSRVGQAHISQPICSAVQIALVDLLSSFGIKPSAVTGHSSGEIGAAYAAGALTLEGAMSAAYFRGQAIITLKQTYPELKGSMMAIGCGTADCEPLFKQLPENIKAVAACENSPSSTTISGDTEAIDRLGALFQEKEIFNRKLFVDVAYHSPHMKLVSKPYYDSISDISIQKSDSGVEFFSSVRGRKVQLDELGPQYWCDNLENPVRFATALSALVKETEPDLLVEIGPHAALKGPIMQTLKTLGLPTSKMPNYFPTLVRGRDASETALEVAGNLWLRGYEDLNFFNINHNRVEVEKPDLISFMYTYPWSRQKCWYEGRITNQHRFKRFPRHDLIGSLADWSSDLDPTWRNFIRLEELPWLKDNQFDNKTVFPLSAYVSMAIEAASQRAQMRGLDVEEGATYEIRDLRVTEQLELEDKKPVEIVLQFRPYGQPDSSNLDEFQISTYEASRGWTKNASGLVQTKPFCNGNALSTATTRRVSSKWTFQDAFPANEFYEKLSGEGMTFPRSSASLVSLTPDEKGVVGTGKIHDTKASIPDEFETNYVMHPSVIDPLLQLPNSDFGIDGKGSPQLPFALKQLQVNVSNNAWKRTPGSRFFIQSTREGSKKSSYTLELFADAEAEDAAVTILGLEMEASKATSQAADKPRSLCFKVDWESMPERQANGAEKHADKKVTIVTERSSSNDLVSLLAKTIETQSGIVPKISNLTDVEEYAQRFIVLSELDRPLMRTIDETCFEQLKKLLVSAKGTFWVTRGASNKATNPTANMAIGLLRTVRSELGTSTVTLDLDPESGLDAAGQAELIEDAFSRTLLADGSDTEVEFVEKEGKLMVPRIAVDEEMNLRVHREIGSSEPYFQDFKQPSRHLQLRRGAVADSLVFEDAPIAEVLGENEVEIEVAATRITREDTIASKSVFTVQPERSVSGIVTRIGSKVSNVAVKDRVAALAEGALSTHVLVAAQNVARLPENISFEQAASIPASLATASYALVHVARVEKGERVLIHVEDDTALSAVALVRYLGAETYVAVNNAQQKTSLVKTGVAKAQNIFDVSSVYFSHEAKEATKSTDIDVVFTSSSPSPDKSKVLELLAPFGRVVEIRRSSSNKTTSTGHPNIAENSSFTSINMLSLASARPKIMENILKETVELYEKGILKYNSTPAAFGIDELDKALGLTDQSTLQPVAIAPKPGDQAKITHPTQSCKLSSDGTHVIIGGTGGLGRSMAKWMIDHGARTIVLLSRSGSANNKVAQFIAETRGQADVIVKACDIADKDQVDTLVKDITSTLPPIAGIVHSAMVLHDGMLENMTHTNFVNAVRSKVDGAWNIHKALAAAQAKPDYFVLFSSAAGVLGSRGQGAYAAANTFLDAFAAYRRGQGLPGVSLDLTAVTGAGYIAENNAREEEILKNFGSECVTEQEVLALLSVAISSSSTGACPAQVLTGLKLNPTGPSGALPYYAEDPRFARLKRASILEAAAAGGNVQVSYRAAFSAAQELAEKAEIATNGVLQKLAEVLSVSRDDVDAQRSMTSYGLDSLTAIEVRNWITRELGTNLQILELLTASCVADLAGTIVARAGVKA